MRFNYILYQKIRFACLLAFCILLSFPVNAQAQKEKKVRQLIDVSLKVVDENGTPVSKAGVVIGEGITHTETDQNGSVAFKGYAADVVTVTAPGFEKNATLISDLLVKNTVTLLKAKTEMTSADIVPLPFTSLKRRYITGPETVVDSKSFEKYPSTDLRSALIGLTSLWDIRQLDGSPGVSAQEGQQNFIGIANAMGATDKFAGVPMVMVDGIITELQEAPIDPGEIESATLLKGILGTSMYGPSGTGGILMIKTKHGVKNERILSVDVENGVSTVDRMPDWVDGATYATLNNQARENSGLADKYTAAAITAYAANDPNSLRYPSVNFRDMILKNTRPFTRVNLSSSGGNDIVQYFSYIGYNEEGDIYKIGSTADYNRINTRQNVTAKISDQFTAQFGFYGNVTIRRSPNYGYSANYTSETQSSNPVLGLTELPMFFGISPTPSSVLGDLNTTPPIAFPVYAHIDPATGTPWYGVNASYTQNPIGGIVSQGYYSDQSRTGASNLSLNYDAGNLIKGLKSTTYFAFNVNNMTRLGKENDYLAYTASISSKTGNDTIIKSSSHGLITQSDMAKLEDYYFYRFNFSENISFDRTFGDHTIQSTLTYNQNKAFVNGVEEAQRNQNLAWTAMYSFKDKYSLQGLLNYAGTTSFGPNERWGLFPSLGANWIISDESFMSNLKFIDFLKLRAQYGTEGHEQYFPVLRYVDRWSANSTGSATGPYSTLQWFGSTTDATVYRSSLEWTGNPNLTFEKREEFNAGFDSRFLNQKLLLDVSYYNYVVDGIISQVSNIVPLLVGINGARPYYNYAKTQYNGITADLHYTDKIGEVEYTIGGNATTMFSKALKYDEPTYRWAYQQHAGKAADAIFGLVYQGKFATDAEATATPVSLYDATGTLKAGDLKYKDMNGDGFIDDNDQTMIGHSTPRLFYAVNVDLKYKNFELFVLGNGRAFYDVILNNIYFQNGWGDNTYSNFVANNVGGAYPRLTYYKVNNNFVTSAYWLAKGDYFKIQNVELSYTIPAKYLQFMGSRGIKVYIRGSNLLTFSKLKDVDPETMYNSGGNSYCAGVTTYPLYRTISGGVKFNF